MNSSKISDADLRLLGVGEPEFLDAAAGEVLEFAFFEEEPNAEQLRSETKTWLTRQTSALKNVICENKFVNAVCLLSPAVAAEKIHDRIREAIEEDGDLLLTSVAFLKYVAIYVARAGIQKLCQK